MVQMGGKKHNIIKPPVGVKFVPEAYSLRSL